MEQRDHAFGGLDRNEIHFSVGRHRNHCHVVNLDFTYKTSGDTLYGTTSVLGVETTQKYTFSIEGSTLTLNGDYETISLTKQ